MEQLKEVTEEHFRFAAYLLTDCLYYIRYDDIAREKAKKIYESHARRGRGIVGVREALISLCGYCEFNDDILTIFRQTVRDLLNQEDYTRAKLDDEDKNLLMKKFNMVCAQCGNPLTTVNFDHILPFFIVGETLELANRQCLCDKCNRLKSSHINANYAQIRVRA